MTIRQVREEIDAAYHRGVEDGRDSVSALPVLLAGMVAGALSMVVWLQLI